jgi:hypothetical protein
MYMACMAVVRGRHGEVSQATSTVTQKGNSTYKTQSPMLESMVALYRLRRLNG